MAAAALLASRDEARAAEQRERELAEKAERELDERRKERAETLGVLGLPWAEPGMLPELVRHRLLAEQRERAEKDEVSCRCLEAERDDAKAGKTTEWKLLEATRIRLCELADLDKDTSWSGIEHWVASTGRDNARRTENLLAGQRARAEKAERYVAELREELTTVRREELGAELGASLAARYENARRQVEDCRKRLAATHEELRVEQNASRRQAGITMMLLDLLFDKTMVCGQFAEQARKDRSSPQEPPGELQCHGSGAQVAAQGPYRCPECDCTMDLPAGGIMTTPPHTPVHAGGTP